MTFYDKLIPQRSAVTDSWDRLNLNRERSWDLYGYDIGIHPINMAIGGIVPTRLTVVGGRSGSGKTALSVPMFNASTRRKVDGSRLAYLFFTWELDPSIVIDRSICSTTSLTLRQLNQGAKLLTDKTMAAVKTAYDFASKFPIHYHIHSTDINDVRAVAFDFIKKCREISKVEGAYVHPVILIDYLNMAQFDTAGLRTYGIADFMNGLKQLCNQERCSAIVFAQLSRETDRQNKIPDRADFSDSAAIENAADNLLVLYRPEYHGIPTIVNPDTGLEIDSRGKALIRVLKGRDYGVGDFIINCDIKHFRFWDFNHHWDEEYYKSYSNEKFWIDEFGLQVPKKIEEEELPF